MRLGARLGIPQKVLAVYDRITEAIKSLIGKQDIIKQFYAQMETGKFRNSQQVPGGDGRIKTMSLDSDVSERAVRSFNSVRRGKQIKSVVGQLSEDGARKVAEALRSTDFNKKARLIIDKNAVNHLRNSGHLTGLSRNGADANPLTEADIRALPHVFSDPDVVYMSGTGRTGKRMVFERQLDNHHRIVAELEYSGKDFNLVTYFNINKDLPNDKPAMSYSPEGVVAADESGQQPSRPGRSSSDPDNGFNGSIPNVPQNVNNDLRFKHPLQDQIDDIQNNPKLKMTKELCQAIDEEIYNYYPELFVSEAANLQSTNGDWNIPRLHVDDLIAIEQKTVKRLQHLALKRAPSRRHYVGKFFMYRNTRTITVYLRHNIKPPRIIWMRVNNYARVTPELLAQLKQRNRAEDSFGNQNKTTRARLKNSYFHRIW